MASSDPSRTPALDLDALIQNLPACKRCRECRRGCDTLLPRCRQCTKAGVECMFFDHGRDELLPRSYIADLVDRVRRLAPEQTSSSSTHLAFPDSSSASVKAEASPFEPQPRAEHHFAFAGDSYRYLGAESCLLQSPIRPPSHVKPSVALDDDDSDFEMSWKNSAAKEHELMELYIAVIQPIYPVLDLSAAYIQQAAPSHLTPNEIFCRNVIYSIGCYCLPNTGKKQGPEHVWDPSGRLSFHQANSIKHRTFARGYYNTAMEYLEEATVDPNIATLRAVLLLAIHSTFDPKSGNIGQQIALAARLAYDLEAQAERLGEPQSDDVVMLSNMHMTIFMLENLLSSTMDRPALFPEPTTPLSFDKSNPAIYTCSLLRLQHRFRKGDHVVKEQMKRLLPPLDERAELLPIVRIFLHMTHLLLNPVWGSAWHVLEAVVSIGAIHIYVTPQWVYLAGTVLIENMPAIYGGNLIQLYSNALLVLELSSWKWPSSASLSASLMQLMQDMKLKYQPEWSNKLQHGGVTI